MKKLLLTLLTIGTIVGSARADLHDSYQESCNKYGRPFRIDMEHHYIAWYLNRHVIVERFVKNECVFLRLIPEKGTYYSINDVWSFLRYNCGPTQSWVQLQAVGDHVASWATNDDLVLASLYTDGSVQLAFKWYIEAKGHLERGVPLVSSDQAPVEDDM